MAVDAFPEAEVTVTCAWGMTAPLGSNTLPCSVPVDPWLKARVGEAKAPSKTVIRVNKYVMRFIVCAAKVVATPSGETTWVKPRRKPGQNGRRFRPMRLTGRLRCKFPGFTDVNIRGDSHTSRNRDVKNGRRTVSWLGRIFCCKFPAGSSLEGPPRGATHNKTTLSQGTTLNRSINAWRAWALVFA